MPVYGCVHVMTFTIRSFNSSGTESKMSTDLGPDARRSFPGSLSTSLKASPVKCGVAGSCHLKLTPQDHDALD